VAAKRQGPRAFKEAKYGEAHVGIVSALALVGQYCRLSIGKTGT